MKWNQYTSTHTYIGIPIQAYHLHRNSYLIIFYITITINCTQFDCTQFDTVNSWHILYCGDHFIFIFGLEDLTELGAAAYNAQLNISHGGLGIINASARAIPDFVLTMTKAMRIAASGFKLHPDLEPIILHPSVSDLFLRFSNPTSISMTLQRYHHIMPQVANIACSDKVPKADREDHLHSSSPPRVLAVASNNAAPSLLETASSIESFAKPKSTSITYPAS